VTVQVETLAAHSRHTDPGTCAWDSGPEPDVTWGRGGIDDWGWASEEPGPSSEPCPTPAALPTQPKGA
jgi:hypothetical protein